MNTKNMLKKPRKVLCYVALSKNSPYLVKYAYELSNLIDAELFVLHTVTDIKGLAGFYVPHINMDKLEEEVIQAARDKLYAICHQAVGDSIDMAHRIVRHGGLLDTVDEIIKEKQIELIVLPQELGKGNLSLFRGDYAERFMKNAAIPFLVLPM